MLCYSTASLPDSFSSTDIAEALLPTPFRGVELVVTPEWLRRAGDASFWHGFRHDLEARGLRVRNVQLGHPHLLGPIAHSPGLSATDPAGRRLRVEAAVAAAGIAEKVGSGFLTVTTGLPEQAGDFGYQESLFKKSLAEIVARRPRSVKVAIEQEPEHVIRSAEQVLGLCRAFDPSTGSGEPGDVFSNYDVGHGAVLGEDPAAAVRLLGKYLSNLHLEDIRGRTHKHLLFGEGDVDFRALFRALREIGYAGDLTPDLYPYKDEPSRALRESAEFLTGMGIRK